MWYFLLTFCSVLLASPGSLPAPVPAEVRPQITSDGLPPPGIRFGRTVLALRDLDGDGVSDFAVGAPDSTIEGKPRRGRVFFFSGRTQRRIASWSSLESGRFRWLLHLLSHGASARGSADVLVSTTSKPMAVSISARSIQEEPLWGPIWVDAGVGTGVAWSPFDDVDADGVRDVLVGISQWEVLGVPTAHPLGEVRLLSGASGECLWTLGEAGLERLEDFLDETVGKGPMLLIHGTPQAVKGQVQELARHYQDCVDRQVIAVDLSGDLASVRIGDLRARPTSDGVCRHFELEGDGFEMVLVSGEGIILERFHTVVPADAIWRRLADASR